MAKIKRPNLQSLKQGQTVYVVNYHLERRLSPASIMTLFLYSHNQSLPKEGYIIEKMPITYFKKRFQQCKADAFYKLKNAEKFIALYNAQIDQATKKGW